MTINYVLNDPSTPLLIIPVELPDQPGILDFKIDGFRGATDAMYTLEHQAAMCHYSLVQAIQLMNKFISKPIERWSSTNTLFVQPRAGKQFNAYYDRAALRFFYAVDPVINQLIYSVNSSEVVLHETGHALLDALRPDLFNVQAMEIWAFHESFGDIHSIINLMQHDLILDYVLTETSGNLAQNNILTKLAQEMGKAIYDVTGGNSGSLVDGLRNAFNAFMYTEPERLVRSGNDSQLTSEPHNFSRVFTGTWYDLLVGIYQAEKDSGLPPKIALINARDILTSYTYNAIPNAPATIRFFDGFVKSMLAQDKLNNSKYNTVMNNVFIKRGILRQPVRPLTGMSWMAFKNMVEPRDQVVETQKFTTVRSKEISLLTLPDHMLNVETPNDTYYEFDEFGNCVDIIGASAVELIDHARECVVFLKDKGLIRPDAQAPFEIDNYGNLIRSHFSNCFCNGTNPTQPEFLKAYKVANNAGCNCGGQGKPTCCVPAVPQIVIGANTRLHTNNCGFSKISNGPSVTLTVQGQTVTKAVC